MLRLCSIASITLFMFACQSKKEPTLFKIRHGAELGLDFQNTIVTNDSFNALSFEYIYNGSGVGVGDFNNDGLSDLFFGGNQVSSKLYLNQGNLKFKDVTQQAGISTDRWVTGVSVVDINTDGLDDIFLCVAGMNSGETRRDLLFINQGLKDGLPVFKESSKAYGLDDESYTSMAAFFDYDKDGDLDVYLVNNWLERYNRNNLRPKRTNGEAESTDRFYRNNGNNTFTNVSREAGILIEGYGLGINICDINQDSWPDVYVSNDFMSNDLIWINQQNGTFKNMAGEYLKHQTHNGMGIDIADFNNDALPDILEVDMLPPDHKRQKLMTPGQNYDNFHMSIQLGYQPQYMRNTLQLNRGKCADGRVLFSEIAFIAGVAKTDWSWAPLFADFDNDGRKDIFIGNGYRKDITNLDFIFFGMEQQSPFGTDEARQKKYWESLEKLDEVQTTNHVYRNTGTLQFEDKTEAWGVKLPTYTNGTAYADFDNDGDLDLVTNNIDQEVVFYENKLNTLNEKNHFIRLVARERNSLNQKIWVYTKGVTQYQELTPYRGFQSSVGNYVHFGVGQNSIADSVRIQWPDLTELKLRNVKADTILFFSKSEAKPFHQKIENEDAKLFERVNLSAFKHKETSTPDIKITRTLLHELSRYGPCLAAGDINGDKLDDFFVGGEVGAASRIFLQRADGTFQSKSFSTDSTREDGGALFFDADNDGDLDLYVAAASPSSAQQASVHQLFKNDRGVFSLTNALPEITVSASCIESADYDSDGDLDLFVGGRIKTNEYPLSPRSYVLRNDKGKFVDITNGLNTELEKAGMVSSAVWADVDNDGKIDLILAGEWMPIRIFKNDGVKFNEVTKQFGLQNSHGWWNCIKATDLNHDGYVDIIAGNAGMNSYFQPTPEQPVEIVAKDFDKNGSMDPIVTYYNAIDHDRFMVHNRLVVIDQIPSIKKRFETFTKFATTPISKVFTKQELNGAFTGKVNSLASVVLTNKQGKAFAIDLLPDVAQLSVINDMLIEDLNHDGNMDVILIGNNYAQETLFGRYDASIGTILLGDGKLHWKNLEARTSGFVVEGDARYIRSIKSGTGKMYVVTNNNAALDGFLFIKK